MKCGSERPDRGSSHDLAQVMARNKMIAVDEKWPYGGVF